MKRLEVTNSSIGEEWLQGLPDNRTMLSGIIEFFPYPIQVYAPDGTMVLINQACMKLMHIRSKNQVVGKFNVLRDPIIDKWGEDVRKQILLSFRGETVQFCDLKLPVNELIFKFEAGDDCSETRLLNITCFPIYDDASQLAYIVHVFVTSKLYDGKKEIVKAKEYIENNWLDDFDLEKTAQSVNLSKYHFSRFFKRYTSMTPFSYYQDIKIKKLKEKLCDGNLSVRDAFIACGLDYTGNYAGLFRKKVGLTPSQYKKTNSQAGR